MDPFERLVSRMSSAWNPIVQHYEQCLSRHGISPAGVDWPNGADLAARFGVMFELLDDSSECYSLLDIGCGTGFALDYLAATGDADRVQYHGIDLSQAMLDAARKRWHTHEFSCRNIVTNPMPERSVDVAIMNGVLTERVAEELDTVGGSSGNRSEHALQAAAHADGKPRIASIFAIDARSGA
jgi:SAM-dependent methyltransferase